MHFWKFTGSLVAVIFPRHYGWFCSHGLNGSSKASMIFSRASTGVEEAAHALGASRRRQI